MSDATDRAHRLRAALEETLAVLGDPQSSDHRIRLLSAEYRSAVAALECLLDTGAEPLSSAERDELRPLLAEARRLNALVAERARRESARVQEELSKVRRALDSVQLRRHPRPGRSCDVSG